MVQGPAAAEAHLEGKRRIHRLLFNDDVLRFAKPTKSIHRIIKPSGLSSPTLCYLRGERLGR
jgi:hypothetical protein